MGLVTVSTAGGGGLSPPSILPAGFTGTLVYNDEFNTGSSPSNNYRSYYGATAAINATLASTFTADFTTDPNYASQQPDQQGGITSAASTISGGVLSVAAINAPSRQGGVDLPYTRGLVRTVASWQYGYFEASLKIPAGKGLWPAFWLWPTAPGDLGDNWKEIDILEAPSTGATGIYHNVHWGSFSQTLQSGPTFKSGNFSTGFHIFGCLWTPSAVRFYVDGVETTAAAYTDPSHIPDVPLAAHIDYQIGGSWPGNPDGTTPWPTSLDCQFLRIYR